MAKKAVPISGKLNAAVETLRACLREMPNHELQIGLDKLTLWEMETDNTKSVSGWEIAKFTAADELIAHMNKLTNKKAA